MGVSQHSNGTANAHGVINLALAAGMAGKPGNGISPLRGQNNVQGCGDAGLYPGQLARLPGADRCESGKVRRGLGADDLAGGRAHGHGDGRGGRARRARRRCTSSAKTRSWTRPIWATRATPCAIWSSSWSRTSSCRRPRRPPHVVLPATSFAEKEGTFTNSERRVQRVRQALQPIGQSRPDWAITADIARRVCRRLGLDERQFAYASPREIFDEMAALTPIVVWAELRAARRRGRHPVAVPGAEPSGHAQPVHREVSARQRPGPLDPVRQGPAAMELPDDEYPIVLNTGRVLYHWHGGTITIARRRSGGPGPEVQATINPVDAQTYGIAPDGYVRVTSRRGTRRLSRPRDQRSRARRVVHALRQPAKAPPPTSSPTTSTTRTACPSTRCARCASRPLSERAGGAIPGPSRRAAPRP